MYLVLCLINASQRRTFRSSILVLALALLRSLSRAILVLVQLAALDRLGPSLTVGLMLHQHAQDVT